MSYLKWVRHDRRWGVTRSTTEYTLQIRTMKGAENADSVVKEEGDHAVTSGEAKATESSNGEVESVLEDSSNEVSQKDETLEQEATVSPFDHSNRRVIVYNVDKYMRNREVEKLVKQWMEQAKLGEITPNKPVRQRARKPPKDGWITITFESEAMCKPFIEFINTSGFKNKKGERLRAAQQDSGIKRPVDGDDGSTRKRPRTSREDLVRQARRYVSEEEIRNKVTPLWKLSQEEQRMKKQKEMVKACAVKLVSDVKAKFR